MKAIFNPILNIHIAFGFAGMTAFWVAALSKKGSTPHIWVGRWYALCMGVVSLSSLVLAAMVIFDPLKIHPQQDPKSSIEFAEFLFFLGLLTLSTTYNGLRFMRQKEDLTRLKHPLDIGLNALTLVGGLAIVALGLTQRNFLLVFFGGFVGLISPGKHLLFLFKELRKPQDVQAYLSHHIGSMIGSGIALHTAFLVGGAAFRYFPWLAERTGYLFWFTPTILGTAAQGVLRRKYVQRERKGVKS